MPWQKRWPPYVSQKVIDDRRRAVDDLAQASDDLKDTVRKAVRTHRVADSLEAARARNHFSESMELLFATRTPRASSTAHHPKDTP
jgi:hypothetical protein